MQTFNPKQYLAIDIANNYGLDKVSWDERIQWVKDNYSSLEGMSDNPLYIKAVHALREVDKGYPTNHMMSLDATASGYQIISCITDDEKGCLSTNVLDSGERMDIYTRVGQIMGVSRDVIKKPLMTMAYGSVLQPELTFSKPGELEKFYRSVNEAAPGVIELMNILELCWNSESDAHCWTMPDGFQVVMKNEWREDFKIESNELGSVFTYRTTVTGPSKRSTPLLANFVHSIDGYIAREMVRMAHKQGFQLGVIHDSYWFSPVYGNQVRRNYNIILSRINEMKLLQTLTRKIARKAIVEVTSELSNRILAANYSLS
jgi:DNA-directed RNA polymerase